MSKRGKKNEDYASEDEEPNKRPKKSSKADDSDDAAADDIVVCEVYIYKFINEAYKLLFNFQILSSLFKRQIFFLDIQESEGFREELAREDCGGHSRVLCQRWQATSWEKRFISDLYFLFFNLFLFLI